MCLVGANISGFLPGGRTFSFLNSREGELGVANPGQTWKASQKTQKTFKISRISYGKWKLLIMVSWHCPILFCKSVKSKLLRSWENWPTKSWETRQLYPVGPLNNWFSYVTNCKDFPTNLDANHCLWWPTWIFYQRNMITILYFQGKKKVRWL